MGFFRFYFHVLKQVFWVSLGKAVVFATILAVLGGALAYFFPNFIDLVGIGTWLIPIAIFLGVAAIRLILAPHWIYLDEVDRAENAESQLLEALRPGPRLRFLRARLAQMYRWSPFVKEKIKIYEMLQAWFENRPETPTDASIAGQLTATLEFQSLEETDRTFEVHGQWAESTEPDHVGYSSTTPTIDISPGAMYGKLIVALKYRNESSAYVYSSESLRNHIHGRNPSLELTEGEYLLRVNVTGIGVDESFQFSLTNPGEDGVLDLHLQDGRDSTGSSMLPSHSLEWIRYQLAAVRGGRSELRFVRRIKEIFGSARHVDIDGELSFETRLVGRKISKDGTESIRVKESSGRVVDADIDETGAVAIEIQGQSPQGEQGALAACQILVEHLNAAGAMWGEPLRDHQPERGVDCIAKDGDAELLIQVTRIPDPAFWRELANRMHLARTSSTDALALELYAAIRKKQNLAPSSKVYIVLAVDAMDTPAHATQPVMTILRSKYGRKIDALGYRSVWVVGPVESACIRLDNEGSAP